MLTNLLIVSALVISLWAVSVALKNASIVDIFWGFGFVVIAWSSYLLAAGDVAWRAHGAGRVGHALGAPIGCLPGVA